MIIAGPCLLNCVLPEVENAIETARQLYALDPDIRFRCKLWGGGTTPERYAEGIGWGGQDVIAEIRGMGMKVGTEVRDTGRWRGEILNRHFDFVWIAARACQNYDLLEWASRRDVDVYIKRGPGMTIEEMWGIHDICREIYGYTPTMIERGINSFCRTPEKRWMVDFDGMIRTLQDRPDIKLMLDPSHAAGRKELIFPLVKAACAIGVKDFMLEVYRDPSLTQTDKCQALSVKEFKTIYEYIKTHGGE